MPGPSADYRGHNRPPDDQHHRAGNHVGGENRRRRPIFTYFGADGVQITARLQHPRNVRSVQVSFQTFVSGGHGFEGDAQAVTRGSNYRIIKEWMTELLALLSVEKEGDGFMKRLAENLKKQDGAAMVVAIGAIAIMINLGTLATFMEINSIKTVSHDFRLTEASSIAQAGVDNAISVTLANYYNICADGFPSMKPRSPPYGRCCTGSDGQPWSHCWNLPGLDTTGPR